MSTKLETARIAAVLFVAATVVTGVTPAWSSQYEYGITNFKVVRNGATFFEDTFSDTVPPVIGSDTYGGRGSFGPESGNKLTIDSLGLTNANDPRRLVQKAVVKSNTSGLSADADKGLKSGHTISVTGLFALVVPQTIGEWYFIELKDDTSSIDGTEHVNLGVRRVSASSVVVRFHRKNTDSFQGTVIEQMELDPNHSQIRLTLSKASATSNTISASFAYVDNGVVGAETTFANTTTMFNTNPFVRAAFAASTPVASAVAQGPSTSLTLTGNLKVTQDLRNQQGNVYVAALTAGLIFFNNGSGWVQYVGGAFPVYKRGALAEQTVPVLSNLNVSAFGDLSIFLGFGTSDADLLSNESFSQIYCATTAVCIPEQD